MRFGIVFLAAWLGSLAGAALGVLVLRPDPPPGPAECGMWALPPLLLGGAVGAAVAAGLGIWLTRRRGLSRDE